MESSGRIHYLAATQGAYFFATGAWAILHIESFMAVTGPKMDVWLVKTVGVLVLVIGTGLITAGVKKQLSLPLILIAAGSALGLALIDVIYVWQSVIALIYLLDALIELIFLAFWLILMFKPRHRELFE